METNADIIKKQNERLEALKDLGYDKSSFNAGFFEGFGLANTSKILDNDFKARLIIEYKELKTKTNGLITYLLKYENSNNMDQHDWNLLTVQRDIMISYVSVLEMRLIKLNMQDCLE